MSYIRFWNGGPTIPWPSEEELPLNPSNESGEKPRTQP